MIDFRGFSSRMNLGSFMLAGEENTMHSQQHLYQIKRMIDSAIQDFAERYTARIEAYIKEMGKLYKEKFGIDASFFVSEVGDGGREVK